MQISSEQQLAEALASHHSTNSSAIIIGGGANGCDGIGVDDGCQVHVQGIGVHGWDGTAEGCGEFEDEVALKQLLRGYGVVVAAAIRHRVDMDGRHTAIPLHIDLSRRYCSLHGQCCAVSQQYCNTGYTYLNNRSVNSCN